MHFQVRTDNHIKNSSTLEAQVRSEFESTVKTRHQDRLQRVEVYFQDQNSHKKGVDIRCSIEVSLAGYKPVAVSADASEVDAALTAALAKVQKALEHKLERLDDRGDRVSMSGEPT